MIMLLLCHMRPLYCMVLYTGLEAFDTRIEIKLQIDGKPMQCTSERPNIKQVLPRVYLTYLSANLVTSFATRDMNS